MARREGQRPQPRHPRGQVSLDLVLLRKTPPLLRPSFLPRNLYRLAASGGWAHQWPLSLQGELPGGGGCQMQKRQKGLSRAGWGCWPGPHGQGGPWKSESTRGSRPRLDTLQGGDERQSSRSPELPSFPVTES